ncbi:hypothetical protein F383_06944 [Gossypium arboreum]|uniref:Uncharacterized protein n=1 Tax=Gossypium arboreum TaxID=29729 RepID=A0A0B0PY73_GOSAR|nr:hypothetical protein F383_06944 [Gossypium arboreum]
MCLRWIIYAYMLLNNDEWLCALIMRHLRKYQQVPTSEKPRTNLRNS